MQFSNPDVLWGLFALLIPIIIHLFNFRRYRKIYFTNVKELQDISIKTQKNARLKKIIVLALRMLTITALVIAFAGPYRSDSQQQISSGTSYVSIYIDNSFSMEATEGGMPLLDIAKKRADDIIKSYSVSDHFQLITNDFDAKQQRFLNRDECAEEIEKISYSPIVRTIEEIQTRQHNLLSEVEGDKNCYLISDFQQSTHQLDQLQEVADISTVLMPLEAETRYNISIDSCWFSTPIHQVNELNRLFIKIKSTAEESLKKIPIRLIINNKQVGLANFDLEPKSETVIEIPFTIHEQGVCKAVLEITDFPITFDDTFYFTFSISEEIGVIELTEKMNTPYLSTLFGKDSAFRFSKSGLQRFDFSQLETHSMVVLSSVKSISSGLFESLQTFVAEGGSLVIFYPIESKDQTLKEMLSGFQLPAPMFLDTIATQFSKIALQDMLFSDVFERVPENMEMPTVLKHWDFAIDTHSDPLITFENGAPALLRVAYENGWVYVFPFPLDENNNNFPKQPLFVPTMLRMALLSVPYDDLYKIIGQDPFVAFRNVNMVGDAVPHISNGKDFSFIPGVQNQQRETRFFLYDNIKESGFFSIITGIDSLSFALNYNRKESIPNCFTIDDLNDVITEHHFQNIKVLHNGNLPVSEAITLLHQGDLLWRWFILAVLLFLLGEVLILRFWK
ncbi:MAG: BatA domain-containing protein [Bacteroidales bacterium]|nr:BatA domain-containing protein [Bacteroidales bacterium]